VTTPVSEASLDGGMVRLCTPAGEPSTWKQYKRVHLETDALIRAAWLDENIKLTDWLSAQPGYAMLRQPHNLRFWMLPNYKLSNEVTIIIFHCQLHIYLDVSSRGKDFLPCLRISCFFLI
jgi:hypothetical protein